MYNKKPMFHFLLLAVFCVNAKNYYLHSDIWYRYPKCRIIRHLLNLKLSAFLYINCT